ncbi:protein RESISTANCE TO PHYTOPHTHORA 1, chloroplastic [Beta vulgaris subsp. vulgaris]|uniref:protein RESISTANCE TO PHYTOPHTHORA 1, chloroplastic n=1 Tax=Beta vulgaris subsp. vulgaris TaxID=3555 RepID=UPI0025468A8B|nr:protein RESISTANCE TO PHYTOPHTHORA 1, chloroplastic [Beta vulgaris subsp. vulgaris]
MTVLLPASLFSCHFCNLPSVKYSFSQKTSFSSVPLKGCFRIHGSSDKLDTPTTMDENVEEDLQVTRLEERENEIRVSSSTAAPAMEKDLKKAVNKAAATFAPRASTASKNPAVPGSTLYTVFEVQAYASMLLGGVLSFNLVFPSNEPDIWRLMGMWSIWMFTIPSLRARDCSSKEKEALNYLFLLVPLLNVIIPFFWKSFAVVWSADTVAFFLMYAWKLGWLQKTE